MASVEPAKTTCICLQKESFAMYFKFKHKKVFNMMFIVYTVLYVTS